MNEQSVEIIRARALGRENPLTFDVLLQKIGKETALVLDNLSGEGKKAYVREYQTNSGFPDLTKVSEGIENHAVRALQLAAKKTGVHILFSGYDKSCSVGRKVALPGSDLDGWRVLIRGSEEEKHSLFEAVMEELDPTVFDLWSLDLEGITTEQEVQSYGSVGMRDLEILANPRATGTALLLETMRDGRAIFSNLTTDEDWMKKTRLYNESNFLHKDQEGSNNTKLKHKDRSKIAELFPSLTEEEQFLIVRIIQQVNEGIPIDLNLSEDNPYSLSLITIVNKGLLWYSNKAQDRVFPLWIHKSQNADIKKGRNQFKFDLIKK